MVSKKGILIFPQEAGTYWSSLLKESKLNLIGIHPPGGISARTTLGHLLEFVKTEEFRKFAEELIAEGFSLEYEFHAMSWLLPRECFDSHPVWFRMDEKGERTNDFNMCPSNDEALAYLERQAEDLASRLPFSTNRYFFWVDDVSGKFCHCEHCRELSPSDQALILYNHILRGIRRFNPHATQCYLAYTDTITPPLKVKPDNGIFLEYAPIRRDSARPIDDPKCEKNREQISHIDGLLELFGKENSQVLEYWMDNSRFWNWTPPYKALPFFPEVIRHDVAFYKEKGFTSLTSFGCCMGEEYAREFGKPPVREYSSILE